MTPIQKVGLHRIVIQLIHKDRLKPCILQTQRKTATSRKQINEGGGLIRVTHHTQVNQWVLQRPYHPTDFFITRCRYDYPSPLSQDQFRVIAKLFNLIELLLRETVEIPHPIHDTRQRIPNALSNAVCASRNLGSQSFINASYFHLLR